MEHSFQEYYEVGCVSTTLVLLQQAVLSHTTVHVAMSGQVSGVRGRGPDDTGLAIRALDRDGPEGYLRALGAGPRAPAGQRLLFRVRVILFVGPANLAKFQV